MSAAVIDLKTVSCTQVKNLGYLLRHWQEVEYIRFDTAESEQWGGYMIAAIKGDKFYCTRWADISVFFRWIHRPVFRGLPLIYNDKITKC